ncbi:hypothetical protein ABZ815_19575 [Nonomuraea sp. NPDC047529]|uniref:hypothetical protein n=1 Tax=Nonomuraea sp. NPDC047529 TaxID=3155623 RepID=UPI0034058BE3
MDVQLGGAGVDLRQVVGGAEQAAVVQLHRGLAQRGGARRAEGQAAVVGDGHAAGLGHDRVHIGGPGGDQLLAGRAVGPDDVDGGEVGKPA